MTNPPALETPPSDEELFSMTPKEQMLMDWVSNADLQANRAEGHLRAVLEICKTWQPDYATVMDRKTLRHAEEFLMVGAARAAALRHVSGQWLHERGYKRITGEPVNLNEELPR